MNTKLENSDRKKPGRKRNFDEKDVFQKALMVFWENGFDKTTYEDLVQATGVHRYGLYKVLGDKDQAYKKLLEYYVHHLVADFIKPLYAPSASLAEILDYFSRLKEFNRNAPNGCMVGNSISANVTKDNDIDSLCQSMIAAVKKGFENALRGAIEKSEIENCCISDMATALVGVVLGASTLYKSDMGVSGAEAFINLSLRQFFNIELNP